MTKTFEEVAQSELEQANNIYEAYQRRFKSEVPDGGLVVRIGDQILRLPWLEFAKNWHSDEEFTTKENELKRCRKLNDLYKKAKDNAERMASESGERLSKAQDEIFSLKARLISREKQVKELKKADKAQGKEIVQLKSQAKQQPLPEVPEFVAEIIEYAKNNKKSIRWFFTEDACEFSEAVDWYAGNIKGVVDDIYAERQCLLINAFITGKYTVQKPKRFYLKNKLTTSYLALENKTGYYCHISPITETSYWKASFTQEEIDKMEDTGSYEKIEVQK